MKKKSKYVQQKKVRIKIDTYRPVNLQNDDNIFLILYIWHEPVFKVYNLLSFTYF